MERRERLQEKGYAFWNMGHSKLEYKLALGARVLERPAFLRRWLEERDGSTRPILSS